MLLKIHKSKEKRAKHEKIQTNKALKSILTHAKIARLHNVPVLA